MTAQTEACSICKKHHGGNLHCPRCGAPAAKFRESQDSGFYECGTHKFHGWIIEISDECRERTANNSGLWRVFSVVTGLPNGL